MSSILDRLNGNNLYALSQITRRSGRFQLAGMESLQAAEASDQPTIFAAWHGMTMMLVGFFGTFYDFSRIVLPMPDDWRGEALYIFTKKLGATPFRMNLKGDTTLATARKLSSLVKLVKNGQNAYITPDGPDGPAYKIKPGIAFIAQKANALILPVGAYARHGYRIPRWDQYVVPYPFSRISIQIGAPMPVPELIDDLTHITEPLTDQLHRVTAQAAANYYEQR